MSYRGGYISDFRFFFKKAILMEGGTSNRGGQMMYLFDDLGSHLQNLTPPHVPRVSTVSVAPVGMYSDLLPHFTVL